MRRFLCCVVLGMCGLRAWGQAAAPQAGLPSGVEKAALPGPRPDSEGVYFVGPQVTAPRLLRTMTAGYPTGVPANRVPGFTVLSMVIDGDGKPAGIEVLHRHGDDFDAAARAAVEHCRFAPGMLAGKPVPVRIDVRVPFYSNHAQAVPTVVIAERDVEPVMPAEGKKAQSYTPPVLIHMVDAEFVDPTVKPKYEGVALVTAEISAEGVPTAVRIRRGLGFGMDAKAVAAVKQYRFLPATRHGQPVADTRDVEVKFALF